MKAFAIGLAIALILPFVAYYGGISFSPAAKYHYQNKESFVKSSLPQDETVSKNKKSDADSPRIKQLETEYENGKKRFNKHLFLIAVPIGILSIAAGLLISVPGIGSGLMFGGIFTLIYGYFTYWGDLDVRIRFLSLFFGLVILILVAWIDQRKRIKATGK